MKNIDLIKWLAINCIPEIRIKKYIIDYKWCFRKDVENFYDGIEDDGLKWYTHEEILKKYKESLKNKQ